MFSHVVAYDPDTPQALYFDAQVYPGNTNDMARLRSVITCWCSPMISADDLGFIDPTARTDPSYEIACIAYATVCSVPADTSHHIHDFCATTDRLCSCRPVSRCVASLIGRSMFDLRHQSGACFSSTRCDGLGGVSDTMTTSLLRSWPPLMSTRSSILW